MTSPSVKDEFNIRSSLIKSGGGTGPLKPGNRGYAAVPIPAGENLKDEVCYSLSELTSSQEEVFCFKHGG